jgi:hypothetical protein
MAPSRKRSKPSSKPLVEAVKSWIEEKEGTATLWLVVTEADGDEIRIPARREIISHFSEIVNDLPVAEDSECHVMGFDAETVVEFCRACLPHLDGLPKIRNMQKLIKLVKLAHFLQAPQLLDRWWAELQGYQPRAGGDYIAIFDFNRDVPGKTFTLNEWSLREFPKAYLSLDETIKKKYEKKAYELFQQALEKDFQKVVGNREEKFMTKEMMLYSMVKCLLEKVCPAST